MRPESTCCQAAQARLRVVHDQLGHQSDDHDHEEDLQKLLHYPIVPPRPPYDLGLSSQIARVDSLGTMIRFTMAHGSGIDDVLWFVVPVILAIGVLRVAERRARQRAEREPSVDSGSRTGEVMDSGSTESDVDLSETTGHTPSDPST